MDIPRQYARIQRCIVASTAIRAYCPYSDIVTAPGRTALDPESLRLDKCLKELPVAGK